MAPTVKPITMAHRTPYTPKPVKRDRRYARGNSTTQSAPIVINIGARVSPDPGIQYCIVRTMHNPKYPAVAILKKRAPTFTRSGSAVKKRIIFSDNNSNTTEQHIIKPATRPIANQPLLLARLAWRAPRFWPTSTPAPVPNPVLGVLIHDSILEIML